MSGRQTSRWVDNSEKAFGEKGKIGDSGEVVAYDILTTLGFDVTHNPNDKKMQLMGWDLALEKIYGIDVKTNLRGSSVCVDKIKIWNTKATMWFHLNPNDNDDWVMYYTENMQRHITENNIQHTITNGGLVYFIPREEIEKW